MNKYLTIFSFFLLAGCQKANEFKFVEKKTVIDFDMITKIHENRAILTMQSFRFREYNFYEWCELIYTDSFPKWIKDKHRPDYSFKDYKFHPRITDIDVPYVIFKHKDEDYFNIIKNSDTLKFKIETD